MEYRFWYTIDVVILKLALKMLDLSEWRIQLTRSGRYTGTCILWITWTHLTISLINQIPANTQTQFILCSETVICLLKITPPATERAIRVITVRHAPVWRLDNKGVRCHPYSTSNCYFLGYLFSMSPPNVTKPGRRRMFAQ